ncbi:farnesyl-diphosphate farnesyltransferase [Pseudovirgaria hyperparasitica]|uniref:Squalene synthase n=1 Tax=Pseudovirgaria hyperparasitica TaxID=470096 RepID=A0A6A6W5B5_9PEZI|nr:farnesyl-diphosphate farnesyltransferase [Pseudovirgaria hyperparasitica]KAF2756251.1 farnesyl-diphosphate farnesyltransferase [Pseudovirgaria hyperparasitica]
MPKARDVVYYLFHVQELRNIIQWKVWHNPVHERDESKETPSLKRCFHYLDMTSRSFSAVIKELNPELLVPVCLFYLILRGLDTIEDDMTIPLAEKEPLLRKFDQILEKDGWTFTGNGPNEKDRDLLVEFNVVVEEFKKVKPAYKDIIRDITKKMGDGMADYANNAEHNVNGVNTVKDYELYCHYVAGLVGEGLTRLFVEGKLANPALLERPELMESMGQFLQQVNIIRDIREDLDDGRRFWPKEIWSKHVDKFEDLFKPENEEKALNCSAEMVLTALRRADECLFYLAGLRDQSVFNFCAIPQAMAIATLELCFRNKTMFQRNIKITKGQACRLMLDSTQNLQVLCGVFKDYARRIHKQNNPRDPNFLEISIACGKIEQFIESIFPSQTPTERVVPADQQAMTPEQKAKAKKEAEEAKWDIIYMGLAVLLVLGTISGFMIFVAWMAGARFDIAFSSLTNKISATLPSPSAAGHNEL